MTQPPPHAAMDDVFDPAGIAWTAVSPGLASVRRTILLIQLAVVAVVLVVVTLLTGWTALWAGMIALLVIGVIVWGTISEWRATGSLGEARRRLAARPGVGEACTMHSRRSWWTRW